MKSLMADMIKKKNARVKADAEINKKLVGKNKTAVRDESIKQSVIVEKEVMKESKTLMLD